MRPYYEDSRATVYVGDCRDVLPTLAPAETCITDPPYGLSFMGEGWDRGVPGVEFWEAVAGALRPGASLLAFGGTRTFHRLTCAIEDAGWEIRDCLMWLHGQGMPKSRSALKPAWEPVVLAALPPVVALNIDAARVGPGRWPANLLLDEYAAALLDAQSGDLPAGIARNGAGNASSIYGSKQDKRADAGDAGFPDSGGASRFFYTSKASRRERGPGNTHPTVKPLDLLAYLCRLTATPTGGTVLDPFMGSGSTLIAAMREGRRAIGIELSEEYAEIAVWRIQAEPFALEIDGGAA